MADADLGADPAETMTRMLAGLAVRSDDPADLAGLSQPRRPRVRRPAPEAGRAALVAQPGGARPLHRGLQPHRLHRRHQLVPELRPELGDHPAARRRARHDPVGLHHGQRRPGERDEPGRRSWTATPSTTAATRSSRAPATGCSRKRPTRSTPRCSRSSDRSTKEVADMRAASLKSGTIYVKDDAPDPVPTFGTVLVEVKACGICGSDLHFAKYGAEMLALGKEMGGMPAMGDGSAARPRPGRVHGPRVLRGGARRRSRHRRPGSRHARHVDPDPAHDERRAGRSSTATRWPAGTASGCCCRRRCCSRCPTASTSGTPRSPSRWPWGSTP